MEHIDHIHQDGEIIDKKYSPEEVYEAVKDHLFDPCTKNVQKPNGKIVTKTASSRVEFDGDLVKANSQRLQTFFTKGCKCPYCNTTGKFYIKLRNKYDKFFHLEFIGEREDGSLVLMTKDHIVPKSKGGPSTLDNYQTMCADCNFEKSNN